MNIKQLQNEINRRFAKLGKPMVDDYRFIDVLTEMEIKGMIKKVGNDSVKNNTT